MCPLLLLRASCTSQRSRVALGSQIAARLESLKRASLDAAAEEDSCTLPSRRESFDPLELDGAQFGSAVLNRIENRDMEVSETAASEFLSRRCAVSLAQANRGTRQEERLAEALVRFLPMLLICALIPVSVRAILEVQSRWKVMGVMRYMDFNVCETIPEAEKQILCYTMSSSRTTVKSAPSMTWLWPTSKEAARRKMREMCTKDTHKA